MEANRVDLYAIIYTFRNFSAEYLNPLELDKGNCGLFEALIAQEKFFSALEERFGNPKLAKLPFIGDLFSLLRQRAVQIHFDSCTNHKQHPIFLNYIRVSSN